MKKSNHQVNIVRVTEILPHTNADKLELIRVNGYQVVTQKKQFNVGDLAVYIQPDSVVPQTEPFRFIWEPYLPQNEGVSGTCLLGYVVPEKRRRVTVRKFRGEWSEGLLLPQSDFPELTFTVAELKDGSKTFHFEGDDVSDLLGITHYDPDVEALKSGDNEAAPKRKPKWPRSFKGWFYYILYKLHIIRSAVNGHDREYVSFKSPYYDVDAFKNHTDAFVPGEPVIVTEKIHGSNARFVFLDGKMYAGSRTLWKAPSSRCIWRKALQQLPWIEKWCREHEGCILYGEVTPTQKGFNYGCANGEVKFFLFDILTPDGRWVEYQDYVAFGFGSVLDPKPVPLLYIGPFDLDTIKGHVDGLSVVPGARHLREGVVIKPVPERDVYGLGRLSLKIVSNAFLEKDSKG